MIKATNTLHPSHFITAEKLLTDYKGDQPFNQYLKKYFSQNKKHGGRDRKAISTLCYNFFRAGKVAQDMILSERLRFANESNNLKGTEIFPFASDLSENIDAELFGLSHLHQPKVFIRIRPGFSDQVKQKLDKSGVAYEWLSQDCIAFETATKIGQILEIDNEVVIQDINSQRTGDLIRASAHPHICTSLWDLCAGSGGKSLLAHDLLPNINLTVTDSRKLIINNLSERFSKAGIKDYVSKVVDLTKEGMPDASFDLIIADVPCTGSGTWARNPEQLYFFKRTSIRKYAALQRSVLMHGIPSLRPGGYLLYITCSVFKEENENNVDFIKSQSLELMEIKLFKGYETQSDTLFTALLKVPEA